MTVVSSLPPAFPPYTMASSPVQTPPVTLLLSKLKGVKPLAGGWVALCPAHDDTEPSLKVDVGRDGRALASCHRGCSFDAIVGAVGLAKGDLFMPDRNGSAPLAFRRPSPRPAVRPTPAADSPKAARPERSERMRTWTVAKSYEYVDANGGVVFVVDRYEPPAGPHDKDFAQRRPGPTGWIHNLDGIDERPMYRLPELLDDLARERTILLVEGEKDCDTVRGLGLAAAAHMGGAAAWRPEYAKRLAGADVVILPDNDDPGRAWAAKAGESLVAEGARVRMLALPITTPKADVTDWVQAGGTAAQLERLLAKAILWSVGDPVPLPLAPPKFRLLTVADLESLPPMDWLVGEEHAGIFPAGALLGLFGAPGSGKSFIAADLACTIGATDTIRVPLWLGNAVQRGPVLYVVAEGGRGFRHRIQAWRRNCGLDPATIRLHCVLEPVNLYGSDDVSHVLRAADLLAEPPALVVFDTVARCMVGGDENSAQDMGLVVDRASRVIRELGSSVLLVHHSKKDDDVERGSGSFRGAVDTSCLCRDDEGDGRTLTCEKQKDADPFAPLTFHLVPVGDSCVVSAHAPAGPKTLTEHQRAALKTLADVFANGATATEWLRGTGIRERTFYRVRASLVREGYVNERASGNSTRFYIASSGQFILNAHV